MDRVQRISQLAQEWLEQNVVILDTETTGLDDLAQIVEVSAIDCCGQVLIDTLVRPFGSPLQDGSGKFYPLVPPEAAAVHGITDEMLADAPTWDKIDRQFHEIVCGRRVVIYNSNYDTRLLMQSATAVRRPFPLMTSAGIGCAMLAYAEFRGIWNPRKNGFKWHKLTDAVQQMKVDTSGMVAHRALGDVQMTLGLIKAMADATEWEG